MNDFVKAMLIKELLEKKYIIGYRFKKRLKQQGISISNGSIYLHLKNMYKKKYVTKEKDGRAIRYLLTETGKEALSSNIDSVPIHIQQQMMKLAGLIPNTNWKQKKDVSVFHKTLSKALEAVETRMEQLK